MDAEGTMVESPEEIVSLLMEIRADLTEHFARIDRACVGIDARFDRLERKFDELFEAMNGASILDRLAATEAIPPAP